MENTNELKNYELNYFFDKKNIEQFSFNEIFKDCVYPWEVLKKLKDYFKNMVDSNLKENHGTTGEFVSLSSNYFIGENTKISSNVTIEGPVIIGKNCTIQSGALIRPYSLIGDNVVVGHSCEVKHSIILNKAKVQSFTFIGDSIIGKSTRVGSGTILANRRFDQKNIFIKANNKKIDTGTDFFGSIVGDNTRFGANSTALPGTFIGPYTWILPNVQVRGFIEKEKRLFPNLSYTISDNEKMELK